VAGLERLQRRGDPCFANANAGAAVLNTNISTATAILVWTMMDTMFNGKPSIVGAIDGMIGGLVGITPAAGYVDGWGASSSASVRAHSLVEVEQTELKRLAR
jgi:ammonia channel protein AmtB